MIVADPPSPPLPPTTRDSAVQVEPRHYGPAYLHLPRVVCCWKQAQVVGACGGHRVLEIGVGTGLTAWMLKQNGHELLALDHDPRLGPDLVGDLRHLPLADQCADTVLAAEVLEHIPFEQVPQALAELARVARRHVVVTVPYRIVGAALGINLPGINVGFAQIGLPWRRRHRFDGQHYWEMGRPGFERSAVRRLIREAGLTIVREFRPPLSLYAYGFVLEVSG